MNLFGAPKARKSFLAIQIARDILSGKPFLGHPTTPGRVLYIQLDTPRSLWRMRFDRLVSEFPPETRDRFRLADSNKGSAPFPFNITQPACALWLRKEVDTHKPDLVIIDVWRKCFRGSEDKSEIVEEAIAALRVCTTPSATLVISHARKENPDYDGGVLNEARGSGHLAASCDTIIRLQAATKKKPARLSYEGRATEGRELDLLSLPNHLFALRPETAFDISLKHVLSQVYPTRREQARALAALTGEHEEKCRTALRRALEYREEHPSEFDSTQNATTLDESTD